MSGKISDDVQASEELLMSNLTMALPLLEKAGIVGLIEPINPYWVPNYFLDSAHCTHIRPYSTFMQEGRMFVHRVHVLNVQILAPSNRIPDCTFISVGVNSCTKSMVKVSVLFVQTFAPPGRRGECLYN